LTVVNPLAVYDPYKRLRAMIDKLILDIGLRRHGSFSTPAAHRCARGDTPDTGQHAPRRGHSRRTTSRCRGRGRVAQLLDNAQISLQPCEHLHSDGAEIFLHACQLGCEGIVCKRLGSRYGAGRTDHWINVKNPAAPAVQREADEDWSTRR
jgi:hypothetical protein